MQDPIDQSSRSRERVCVIKWSTVLISFDLSFWKMVRLGYIIQSITLTVVGTR